MSTQEQLADHIDVTRARVRQLVDQGVFPRSERRGWDLDACRVAYIRWLRDRGGDVGPDALDPIAERARKDKEQADKLALENQTRRGELAEVAEVAAHWAKLASETKSHMLALPTKVAPLVIGYQRVAEVQDLLEREVTDALGAIADPGPGVPGRVETTAEDDDQRVGRRRAPAKSRGKRRAG